MSPKINKKSKIGNKKQLKENKPTHVEKIAL